MMGRDPAFGGVVLAEIDKLSSRTSARLGLAMVGLIALAVPMGMLLIQWQLAPDPAEIEAGAEAFAFEAGTAVKMILNARNFFVFRAMIIAVVAVSYAGEIVGRTLREDLVRPVSRSRILAAKWLALQAFVGLGTLVPLAIGVPLAALLFGTGHLTDPLQGYLLTWVGDVGFATMVAAISLTIRSVSGTIGGVFLYWVVDQALGWALWGGAQLYPFLAGLAQQADAMDGMEVVDQILALRPWLPSSAFNLYWDVVPDKPFPWQSAVALALITVVSYAWANGWFRKMDVD